MNWNGIPSSWREWGCQFLPNHGVWKKADGSPTRCPSRVFLSCARTLRLRRPAFLAVGKFPANRPMGRDATQTGRRCHRRQKTRFPIRWLDDPGTNPDLVDHCGNIPTENLPGVLACAEVVISNDSGIYHLGVSLNRPTIAVGGSGLRRDIFPIPAKPPC